MTAKLFSVNPHICYRCYNELHNDGLHQNQSNEYIFLTNLPIPITTTERKTGELGKNHMKSDIALKLH